LQAHAAAPFWTEHAAVMAHPPLSVAHRPAPVQVAPLPEYPGLHAHVFVPGPVLVQLAFGSQLPWLVAQELAGEQIVPSPMYPDLHVHTGSTPFALQVAFGSQPPWLTVQGSTAASEAPSCGASAVNVASNEASNVASSEASCPPSSAANPVVVPVTAESTSSEAPASSGPVLVDTGPAPSGTSVTPRMEVHPKEGTARSANARARSRRIMTQNSPFTSSLPPEGPTLGVTAHAA
jgi:hypothetical protein